MSLASPSLRKNLNTIVWLTLAAIVILIAVYVRLRLLDLPLERDEGEFAYMGQLLLKGIPPYAGAYSLKLPGTFASYALMMELFGQSAKGIHLGLLFINMATIALVFLLAKRLYDARTGAVAAAAYALLSVSQAVQGVAAHATHFVVLFALAGFVCLLVAIERRSHVMVFLSALCFGLSFTMKQHAAPVILFALCFLIWRNRQDKIPLPKQLVTMLLFCGGVSIPYLAWAIYLYQQGVFAAFWFWTVQYAAQYATNTAAEDALNVLAFDGNVLLKTSGALWILAFLQLIILLRSKDFRETRIFLYGLAISSCVAVMPGFFFRQHYFVMMLPAVALLVAAAATGSFDSTNRTAATVRKGVTIGTVLLACGVTLFQERDYFFTLPPRQVSRSMYQANPFLESPAIAAYLRAHTTASDRIGVLGSEPQILFYADRLSATGYLCMYGLMEDQPFADRMQEELIREVETAKPKYIVLVNIGESWLLRLESHKRIFEWAAKYLEQGYDITGVIDIIDAQTTLVWWDDSAYDRAPQALNNLIVYRRRV